MASAREQNSMDFPSTDRMWSPAWSAPHLHTHTHIILMSVCVQVMRLTQGACGAFRYLSAMLAGFTLSMMITCLLQNMEVDRATPRLEPVALATSTSSGPDAVATESDKENVCYHLSHFHVIVSGLTDHSSHFFITNYHFIQNKKDRVKN